MNRGFLIPRPSRPLGYLVPLLLALAGCESRSACERPVPRDDPEWARLHALYRERAQRGSVSVLFLGDSITQNWGLNEAWQGHFQPRGALHFGIGGDGTEHLLYRIENGELGALRPAVFVVLIGTNNLGRGAAPDEVAAGVSRIVEALKHARPRTKILLLGLLPKGSSNGPKPLSAVPDPRIAATNERLSALARKEGLKYLDAGGIFLAPGGQLRTELMPDHIHPNAEGYEQMAGPIEAALDAMQSVDAPGS